MNDEQAQPVLEQAQPLLEQGGQQAQQDGTTTVKVTILDSIVSVNSFFTIAVFLGLTFSSGQQTLVTNPDCQAGSHIYKQLVLYEVFSFSFFLFSSIVAQGLKMAIAVIHGKDTGESSRAKINRFVLYFVIGLSATGSVTGSIFLLLSIYRVIQIRLGMVGCDDSLSGKAVEFLITLSVIGLVVYIISFIYAFWKQIVDRCYSPIVNWCRSLIGNGGN